LDEGGWAEEPAEDDCEKVEMTDEDIALLDWSLAGVAITRGAVGAVPVALGERPFFVGAGAAAGETGDLTGDVAEFETDRGGTLRLRRFDSLSSDLPVIFDNHFDPSFSLLVVELASVRIDGTVVDVGVKPTWRSTTAWPVGAVRAPFAT
jgi:hypothetical protein